MPYIGKSPVGGGFHKLDALTASATATYALTLNGAAYFPETANQLLVSLNGVIQAPQDSFTVSGSNLIFDSALTSNDSIDFVVALGDVLGVGSVTDGAITTAKIGNNAVTSAKLAATIAPTNLETTASTFKMTDLSSNAFYRTGTFVPHWSTANVTTAYETDAFGSGSYLTQAGTYIRIGNLVHANFNLRLDYSAASYANGSAGGQSLSIYGLPFKVKNVSTYFPETSTVYFHFAAQGWEKMSLMGFATPDKRYVKFRYSTTNGSVGEATIDHPFDPTPRAHDSEMQFDITYETDEA